MSQAEELLNSLMIYDTSAVIADDEPHIVINPDRTITIPEELKHIAVQYDHNIETVTFDCPRYWDGHDFSTMNAYINYERSDAYRDQYPVKDLRVDDSDDSIIHFEWTISRNVTLKKGNITFLVCIKTVNADGEEEPHWNSRLNNELIVDPGLECSTQIVESEPDVIADIIDRVDDLEKASTLSIQPVTNGVYFLDLEAAGLPPVPTDGSMSSINVDCSELREVLVNDVIKIQIPISVSGITQYVTAFSLAEYLNEIDIYRLSMTSTTYVDKETTTYVINVDVGVNTITVSVFKMNDTSSATT